MVITHRADKLIAHSWEYNDKVFEYPSIYKQLEHESRKNIKLNGIKLTRKRLNMW